MLFNAIWKSIAQKIFMRSEGRLLTKIYSSDVLLLELVALFFAYSPLAFCLQLLSVLQTL
jgi:hypothetical protein